MKPSATVATRCACGATPDASHAPLDVTAALLQPWALAALYVWSFGVLSAAQLTIRLIMAYKVGPTLVAALVLSVAAIGIAVLDDAMLGDRASLATRIQLAPVPMLLMAFAG